MNVELHERVRRQVALTPRSARHGLAELVRDEMGGRVSGGEALDLLSSTESELAGAGPLEPLLRAAGTTDVLVNGPGEVWLDRGEGLERSTVQFPDEEAVRRLAQRLAALAGRRLDDASPWVDAVLPDGTRLHAVLPPVAVGGTCLSLRTFRSDGFTLDELVGVGTLTPQAAVLVRGVMRARLAFLVSGGTGSGKTTLLGAMLALVDHGERIVIVEDSPELRPRHPHAVRLTVRQPNVEEAGAVVLRDLVRQALRMRPDRLVVGEVRGAEVVELLTALNTGHDGGCGTLHANSAAELPARLEALGGLGGLGRTALHSQLAAAVQVAFHLLRGQDGRRVLDEVAVLRREGDLVVVTSAWRRGRGPATGWPELCLTLESRGVGTSGWGT